MFLGQSRHRFLLVSWLWWGVHTLYNHEVSLDGDSHVHRMPDGVGHVHFGWRCCCWCILARSMVLKMWHDNVLLQRASLMTRSAVGFAGLIVSAMKLYRRWCHQSMLCVAHRRLGWNEMCYYPNCYFCPHWFLSHCEQYYLDSEVPIDSTAVHGAIVWIWLALGGLRGGCVARGGIVNDGNLVQNLLCDVVCGILTSVGALPLSGELFSLRRGTRDIQDQHCVGLPPGNTMTAWGHSCCLIKLSSLYLGTVLTLQRWRSVANPMSLSSDYYKI